MMNQPDSQPLTFSARQEALNPENSYIIQAPAGSGKTELLTQRFLKLLTCVENPESIVALTFTKKAAREMRDRILLAIEKVYRHEKNAQPETDRLAQLVLMQNKKYQWQLLQSPNRLRVQTIDSLCASLVSKMPLLSQGAPYASITEDPLACYEEAAHRCLTDGQMDSFYQKSIQTLLLHLGNHYERCIQLLSHMLSWREQWLPHLVPVQAFSSEQLRCQLEEALKNLVEETERHLNQLFSDEMKAELKVLMNFSDQNKIANKTMALAEGEWRKIANLLLTQNNTWRLRIDKNMGFPSPTEAKNPEEKNFLKSMKTRMEVLLTELRENENNAENLRLALENYRCCPVSVCYSDTQWKILQALISLLPLLAAQLKMVFMEKGNTDFSEISEQASQALGELDNPSELALYLDHSIQHLLIDEFQDTSLKQFRLLEKLTEGWQKNDGRTLFIVGDPMQSIYRFREADVSLFLKARQFGMGNIELKPLTLSRNFRSRPELIEWVNRCFQSIFPTKDDIHLSAVSHHPSKAGRQEYSTAGKIQFYTNETAEEQATQMVLKIQQIQAVSPHDSIAILVRSRKQFKAILPELKRANMAFQGVDIDYLSTRSCIQDLCFLTQTLLQPANVLAWLSVLRAPWCGLSLADLLKLQTDKQTELSEEGKLRYSRTELIITQARAERQKKSLAIWVERTWRKLGGHLCVNVADQMDIERFWELLDSYLDGFLDISSDLFKKVNQLFSNIPQESHLHLMTIHKSKGLEFDHVILPHLEASSGKKDYPLLQHLERRTIHGTNDLILAAMKSIEVQQDDIYQYLQYLNDKKEVFERQRWLYVALTRARTNIHLFAVQVNTEREAGSNTFLKWLQPYLPEPEEMMNEKGIRDENSMDNVLIEERGELRRLKKEYFEEKSPLPPFAKGGSILQDFAKEGTTLETFSNEDQFFHIKQSPRIIPPLQRGVGGIFHLIGTFIHEQIQYCAENSLTNPEQINTQGWKSRLTELGLYHQEEQALAIQHTHQALNHLYQDPRGRWILQPHTQAKNEYMLSYNDPFNDELKNVILDRTFIDSGYRWIIDYKITQEILPKGELTVDFAPPHYQKQLEHYAKLFSQIEDFPIYLSLYYPLTKTWIAWPYNIVLE